MSRVLELRHLISRIAGKYKFWFRTGCRVLLMFFSLLAVRSQIGVISGAAIHPLVLFFLSFLAAFISSGFIALIITGYILICIFAISPAAGTASFLMAAGMLFLYLALLPSSPGTANVTLLTGLMNFSGISAIPTGLFCRISAVLPAAFGLIVSGMVDTVRQNYLVYAAGVAVEGGYGEFTFFIQSFLQNERFWLLFIGFILTALTVSLISKLPFAYAWLVSAAAGVAVYVLTMMIGNVAFDITVNPMRLFLTVGCGFIAGVAGQLCSFMLDGSGAEYLRFEDEEYSYFVKAIPKYSLTPSDTSIKTITEHEHGE